MSDLREDNLKAWKRSKILSTSIQDDRQRREVDAAKKRAAAQNVDYPTFAAMVSAAHLQPVDRKAMAAPSFESEKTVPAWSFGSSGDLLRVDQQSEQCKLKGCISKDEVLQSLASIRNLNLLGMEDSEQKQLPAAVKSTRMTMDSFQKMWRSLAQEPVVKKVEFLAASQFPDIFRVEMPLEVVKSILETLHEEVMVLKQGSAIPETAVEILSSISKCSRFRISLKLMELKCRDLLHRLFEELENSAVGKEVLVSRIKDLRDLYYLKK